MKQPLIRILFVIPAFLLLLTVVSLLLPDDVMESWKGQLTPTGSIIIYVEDGNTQKPLAHATVIIPETKQTFTTDESGKTETIKVPILDDTEYRNVFAKTWGEITLLVYKTGYIDCAIFHVNVWENQTRNGPTVLMFPVTSSTNTQPFTLTEGPNRLWVNELLDHFRPAQVH